ncbi:MAG: OmpA family protein, partial [Bacteroidota bacterium]
GGLVAGAAVGNVGSRAAGVKSTGGQAAGTAAGAVAGAAVGYAICQRAHRQKRDLDARFAALEAELDQARAEQAQTDAEMAQMAVEIQRVENEVDEMNRASGEEPVPGGGLVRTEVVEDRMVKLEITGALVFDSGSAQLAPRAIPFLEVLAESLTESPESAASAVEVHGHTDDTGPEDTNMTLSERRAESVASVLRANGVDGERIVVKGFGESQPIAEGTSAAARAKNRRVEVWIIPSDA